MFRYLKLNFHKISRGVKQSKLLNKYFPKFKNKVYWSGDRSSFARGGFIGMFFMMFPVPFQMVLSSVVSYYLKANIPLATALAWITNPITMGPIWYFGYRFGTWILQTPDISDNYQSIIIGTGEWFDIVFPHIWMPFFIGNMSLGVLFGTALFLLITYINPREIITKIRTIKINI